MVKTHMPFIRFLFIGVCFFVFLGCMGWHLSCTSPHKILQSLDTPKENLPKTIESLIDNIYDGDDALVSCASIKTLRYLAPNNEKFIKALIKMNAVPDSNFTYSSKPTLFWSAWALGNMTTNDSIVTLISWLEKCHSTAFSAWVIEGLIKQTPYILESEALVIRTVDAINDLVTRIDLKGNRMELYVILKSSIFTLETSSIVFKKKYEQYNRAQTKEHLAELYTSMTNFLYVLEELQGNKVSSDEAKKLIATETLTEFSEMLTIDDAAFQSLGIWFIGRFEELNEFPDEMKNALKNMSFSLNPVVRFLAVYGMVKLQLLHLDFKRTLADAVVNMEKESIIWDLLGDISFDHLDQIQKIFNIYYRP